MAKPVKANIGPPDELAAYLKDVVLWGDETLGDFTKIFDVVAKSTEPIDAIDWIWTKSVAELALEVNRYRKFKFLVIQRSEKVASASSEKFLDRILSTDNY